MKSNHTHKKRNSWRRAGRSFTTGDWLRLSALLAAIAALACAGAAFVAADGGRKEASPVVIDRVMTSNPSACYSVHGEYYDWVELRNISGETVSLSGWRLGDTVDQRGAFELGNTALPPGERMIVYCANPLVDESVLQDFLTDMEFAGTMDKIDEKLVDAASALSGSGPAYLYLFLEAMADGAVACGLPRQKAMVYAAATMEGAAQMFMQSGKHPGELKDAVCSPAGSTIVGIQALEQHGFRGAVMDCVIAAYQKNKTLGK